MSASEKAAEAGLTKREWKAQKREKQREDMLKRMEKNAQDGTSSRRPVPPLPPPTLPNPGQHAEDFDSKVDWEQKGHGGTPGNANYGYSSANHLSSAGCAPGEIGGAVADNAISWYADNVTQGPAQLSLNSPLNSSGWCTVTVAEGRSNVGWFNADTYGAPDTVPDVFVGWRQDGDTIRPALGCTGTSFVDGPPLTFVKDKPFQWTLTYSPAGGSNGGGGVTLTVDGSSAKLSLTQELRNALAGKAVNRFGIVTAQTDGPGSTLWLDNLTYTRMSGLPVPHPKATEHTRTAFFDTDPTGSTFFAVHTIIPHEPVMVTQKYGYQATGGRTGGCVGGQLTQAIGTSYFGYDYGEKKLHFTDKLRSEGWFQVPSYAGRCFHLGWTSKKGMSWHEPSTLAMRISSINVKGEGLRINVAAEGTLGNHEGHGGAGWGTLLTIPAGPQWHHYVMEFDPSAAHGLGGLTVNVDGTSKIYYLGEGKLSVGGDIDLFGLWNAKIPAEEKGGITAYIDDVTNTTNGQPDPASNDFNTDPKAWVGRNNDFTAKDYVVRPHHEFGWAKTLPFLDGLNGCTPMYTIPDSERYTMGGIIYLASYENLNVRRASYGAGLNGTLNAKDHHMYATGRFKMDWANVDAGELFGWYNSATACDDVTGGKGHGLPDNFLGVSITGGSTGYGMIPSYRSPHQREEQTLKTWNPATQVHQDGEWREFYMEYDPDGAGGKGQLKLQIGKNGVPVIYDLAEGAKGPDFAFDRFGLLTFRKGGGKPHAIYFDKLTYTVAP
jgi:hypothetical protein